MLDTITLPESSLELRLELEYHELLEWKAQVGKWDTGWHDVESSSHLVGLIQGVSHDGDWLVVQTRHVDVTHFGRYAQAMSTGSGYHVEVAMSAVRSPTTGASGGDSRQMKPGTSHVQESLRPRT